MDYRTNSQTFTVSVSGGYQGKGFPAYALSSIITACQCAQVAGEVLEELCGQMGITDLEEVQEFALFLIKGEGEPRGRDSLSCTDHCLCHRHADSVLCLWTVLT